MKNMFMTTICLGLFVVACSTNTDDTDTDDTINECNTVIITPDGEYCKGEYNE